MPLAARLVLPPVRINRGVMTKVLTGGLRPWVGRKTTMAGGPLHRIRLMGRHPSIPIIRLSQLTTPLRTALPLPPSPTLPQPSMEVMGVENRNFFCGCAAFSVVCIIGYLLNRVSEKKRPSPPKGVEWWRWELMELLRSTSKIIHLKPNSDSTGFEKFVYVSFLLINLRSGVKGAVVTLSIWIICCVISELMMVIGGSRDKDVIGKFWKNSRSY